MSMRVGLMMSIVPCLLLTSGCSGGRSAAPEASNGHPVTTSSQSTSGNNEGICGFVTAAEVSQATGGQLTSKVISKEDGGSVVASSCTWGADGIGFLDAGWWIGQPLNPNSNQRDDELTATLGYPADLNPWNGSSCTVAAAVSVSKSVGVTIIPSDSSLQETPPKTGDDVCARNIELIVGIIGKLAKSYG